MNESIPSSVQPAQAAQNPRIWFGVSFDLSERTATFIAPARRAIRYAMGVLYRGRPYSLRSASGDCCSAVRQCWDLYRIAGNCCSKYRDECGVPAEKQETWDTSRW